MGIDLADRGRRKSTRRREIKSPNPYLKLLVDLYQFLARRTETPFNKMIAKRLLKARRFKAPVSLSALAKHMKDRLDKIAVIVGTVTDDIRLFEVPPLHVCALRFSEKARARILQAGGSCLTFDELALRSPRGSNTVLLRGGTKRREADKHFGKAPGTPHSHSKPYVRSKGRKFEKARGRRASRGFRV